MKIAFTTSDHIHINAHFGWAQEIDVYEVSPESYKFLETLNFQSDSQQDKNENKLDSKIDALSDCTIVYVSQIGGIAAARLIKTKVTPVRARPEDDEILNILNKLIQTLKGNPPPWLRKVLQKDQGTLSEIELED